MISKKEEYAKIIENVKTKPLGDYWKWSAIIISENKAAPKEKPKSISSPWREKSERKSKSKSEKSVIEAGIS